MDAPRSRTPSSENVVFPDGRGPALRRSEWGNRRWLNGFQEVSDSTEDRTQVFDPHPDDRNGSEKVGDYHNEKVHINYSFHSLEATLPFPFKQRLPEGACPRPVRSILAFFDPLLRSVALVVETDDAAAGPLQDGDHEASL